MAAIDVFEQEPVLDASHPLLQLSNVVCTPHPGYVEREEPEDHYAGIFDRILDHAAGRALNAVNPEAGTRR